MLKRFYHLQIFLAKASGGICPYGKIYEEFFDDIKINALQNALLMIAYCHEK
ncbi:MAG: hypothetical protein LBR78_02740 [Holosporales bacterium]|jgi:hypothetical protein|nr:hypothetical protein [Holosporales bacterium]